jgi:valyl-tRNA synthetase
MTKKLSKHYDFSKVQKSVYKRWLENDSMSAIPDKRQNRYVIMMPLPNITGALHMGHAIDNVMQDLLTRWHRMLGDNTLWMPGADHAGIATQAVVEKRLFELEGKTRHDIGRKGLIDRILAWKDEYLTRIINQQQGMGCSCDWKLHRFTMDEVCTRAVREAFFRFFKDGLIFRGNRLVNWDCHLQTAISDDEIVHETINGHFWHIRYPIADAKPDEPAFVVVATTRPETMLGDTAVAVHPDPERALNEVVKEIEEKLNLASKKDRPGIELELEQLKNRFKIHLPRLLKLVEMARQQRMVMLPLLERKIPLILDEWAKPELGSGCVKITPAHDANDYEVWLRHCQEIDIINLLNPDGTYNENAGPYKGLDRFLVRERVLKDLKNRNLLDNIEDREIEIGHSDRSKTPIELYLSKQWFIKMGNIDGGLRFGVGTGNEFTSPGLAQAAIDAVNPEWKSPGGRHLTFHPDPERYASTYKNWLSEKRDWCISRQLWWGHQIPIWQGSINRDQLDKLNSLMFQETEGRLWGWITDEEEILKSPGQIEGTGPFNILVCIRSREAEAELGPLLEAEGLIRDPDVLDTWFSSALWPFSTLGWPDPENAEVGPGKRPLGQREGNPDYLDYYYPGSCLVTDRGIITLWVVRMLIMGLYLIGDVPFTDCFIHATIQDGKGERMSKSKGNGIDPNDIVEEYGADAMRYVLCDMQTGTQDIRLPVQAISPFTGNRVDLTTASHGRTIFTYICPETQKEFDVLGTIKELPKSRVTSDRINVGRAFCTKLWNATRFALMNLDQYEYHKIKSGDLEPEDQWILSRLSRAIEAVTRQLQLYNPSAAIGIAREFFWAELCDWYLEFIKSRLWNPESARVARTVLAFAIDQVLRLLHPFVPFITEALWEMLNELAPVRGLEEELVREDLLISSSWPGSHKHFQNEKIDEKFRQVQQVIRSIRNLRVRYQVSPSKKIEAIIKARKPQADGIREMQDLIQNLAALKSLKVGSEVDRPVLSALQVEGDMEIYLVGILDPAKEKAKLEKQKSQLEDSLENIKRKLSNSNFIRKAPARVVENEQKRIKEIKSQLELVNQNLKSMS